MASPSTIVFARARRLLLCALLAWLPGSGAADASGSEARRYLTAAAVAEGGSVFVALAQERAGWLLESRLLRLDAADTVTTIALPAELRERAVRAILTGTTHVYVLSQWVLGGGDAPQLHARAWRSGEWHTMGEADCVGFDLLQVIGPPLRLHLECPDHPPARRIVTLALMSGDKVGSTVPLLAQGEVEVRLADAGGVVESFELRRGELARVYTASRLWEISEQRKAAGAGD
jgi:hypothetical protein